jgi:hypothetical protein
MRVAGAQAVRMVHPIACFAEIFTRLTRKLYVFASIELIPAAILSSLDLAVDTAFFSLVSFRSINETGMNVALFLRQSA